MAGVNKAIIVGRLGFEPESREVGDGRTVTNIRVATNEAWGKGAERKERTEWHKVVLFGRLAEIARDYLAKGAQVYIEGRLRTNEWTDKAGQTRRTTEILGEVMQMLGGRGDRGGAQARVPGKSQDGGARSAVAGGGAGAAAAVAAAGVGGPGGEGPPQASLF